MLSNTLHVEKFYLTNAIYVVHYVNVLWKTDRSLCKTVNIDLEKLKQVFGQNLATARKVRRLSQADLAERVGVSRVTIANIEGGKQNVHLGQLYSLANAINASPKQLLPEPAEVELNPVNPEEVFLRLAKKSLDRIAGGVE